jgi:Gpi18-like mannosyltransferase
MPDWFRAARTAFVQVCLPIWQLFDTTLHSSLYVIYVIESITSIWEKVNDPSAFCAGLAGRSRKPVVVQPKFLIPQAGRRGNSVRPVRTPRNASSIPGHVVQH